MSKRSVTKKIDPFLNYSSDDSSNDEEADDCRNCCKPQNYSYFATFLRESSIHGLKYIGQLQQSSLARLFWVVTFFAGVGTSVYLIMVGVAADILANPVIMSFQESEITIDRIPFPAVTICSSSKIKYYKFLEQLKEYISLFDGRNSTTPLTTNETQDIQRRYHSLVYLDDLCRDTNGFSDHFKSPEGSSEIANVSADNSEVEYMMKYARNALHKCENIVLLCMWANKPMDCAEEFIPIITEYGNCCTFNMMPEGVLRNNYPHTWRKRNYSSNRKKVNNYRKRREKEIQAWGKWAIDKHLIEKETSEITELQNKSEIDVPKHQRSSGMTTGLSILIHPDFDRIQNKDYVACDSLDGVGFRIQVHSPIEYPHISDFGKTIQTKTETFIDVTAAITLPDKEVEDISLRKRRCYFNREYKLRSFKDYTQKNCFDECIMDEIFKKCKCVRFYMPRQTQPLCIHKMDFACIKNATSVILEEGAFGFCKHCLPSCTQIEYFAATTEFPLRDDVNLWKRSVPASENAANLSQKEDVSIVHLYFSRDVVESRARKSLYGLMEILAGAGGVIGLTLGISMISFIEPIYFLTIRLLFERKPSPRPKIMGANKNGMGKPKNNTSNKPMKIFVQSKKNGKQQEFGIKHIPRAWIQN